MARKQVNVQVTDAYLNRVQEIRDRISEAGMKVEDEFPALGHFRGVAEENDIARLKSITGVESVKVTGDEGSQPGEEYTISTSET